MIGLRGLISGGSITPGYPAVEPFIVGLPWLDHGVVPG